MRIFASPRCLCFLCLMSVIKKDVIINLCVCLSKSRQPVDVWPRNSLSSARTLNCFNPNLPQGFMPKLKGTTFFLHTTRSDSGVRGSCIHLSSGYAEGLLHRHNLFQITGERSLLPSHRRRRRKIDARWKLHWLKCKPRDRRNARANVTFLGRMAIYLSRSQLINATRKSSIGNRLTKMNQSVSRDPKWPIGRRICLNTSGLQS